MPVRMAGYNERSWAIDLIGHLKLLAGRNNRSIKDAGGEQTISTEGGSLFPDVLLFGDRASTRILQGWELKMPDTDIDDVEFRRNAEVKATALGLDSFLLWNVAYARLYVRHKNTDQFILERAWSDLADIRTRGSVVRSRNRWEALATTIVGDLNDLFDRGELEGRQFIEAYRSGGITALIMENNESVAEALGKAAKRDPRLRAEMVLWWDRYRAEYGRGTKEEVLGQAVISNWIGKILFAHILREMDVRAQGIADLRDKTTPAEALELFRQLSEDCDFWTIFSDSLGLAEIPDRPWSQLKQFNSLLTDLRVGSVDQVQLSSVMEATVEVAVRKFRGQYPTPIELARLLVNMCVGDIVDDRVLDPCCGSGTIARAALELKLEAGVRPNEVSGSIFAGDLDPQAVQISTFALTKPTLMNMPLRIFQEDAFGLQRKKSISFRNPTDGSCFSEQLGQFEVIVSNLPFVAQAGRNRYGNAIQNVTRALRKNDLSISGRADVAAYLPFSLHRVLKDKGRLGIIITNAWMGTDWGDAFYESLDHYFDLKCVVTSGAGRWFQSSDVVTNILVMEKKSDPAQVSGDIKFVVLTRPIEEMADGESAEIAAAQIELGRTQNETMTIRAVSHDKLQQFRHYGLGGNAQFVNCNWILELPLVPLKNLFSVRRGERRGMNALFYPTGNHGIEDEYIRPLAKSPTAFTHLCGQADKEAFSCSRSMKKLKKHGHRGALAWIERFKTPENVERLRKKGMRWYEMKTDTLTELVMFINYGDRLFVGRLNPPSFVDQRLVRLDPLEDLDLGLCHALLNSSIAMFIIEGLGFGRGLGALDLNKDRIEDFMHILDPNALDWQSVRAIKDAFLPLLGREVLGVADELEQRDRQEFDDVVIEAFGLNVGREVIYESLRGLIAIRLTAND